MGTSYESMLVAAALPAVVAAVAATGREAITIPVADERVAVVPREDEYGVAELRPIAVAVSRQLGCAVLTSVVFDSDLVECAVYRDGRQVHRYLSDVSMAIEWFEDTDGEFKAALDGGVFGPGEPLPQGSLGAEAEAFVPFVVGPPDLERIGAALRGGEESDDLPPAELWHRAVIESLGLAPDALTVGHRHVDPRRFPAARRVGPVRPA